MGPLNKTLNQRIYETPADVKKAIYDSGYEAGKASATEQIFEDLEELIAANKTAIYSPHGNYIGQGVSLGLFKNVLAELKKKYGID